MASKTHTVRRQLTLITPDNSVSPSPKPPHLQLPPSKPISLSNNCQQKTTITPTPTLATKKSNRYFLAKSANNDHRYYRDGPITNEAHTTRRSASYMLHTERASYHCGSVTQYPMGRRGGGGGASRRKTSGTTPPKSEGHCVGVERNASLP